jgi:23S rRNA (guanosine2251-2'-O)-methyltransferase
MKKEKHKSHEVVYGFHPVHELLKARKRKVLTLYTTKRPPKVWNKLKALIPQTTRIQFVDKSVLDNIAGTSDHQSLVALASPFEIRKKFFNPNKHSFLVMLDGIQDQRNLGAIIRSSYCTGVDGIIITEKNSAPLNAVVSKSSAGLIEHIPVYYARTAKDAVTELSDAGYHIYAATINGQDASQTSFEKPLCVVIGSEGKGVSPAVKSSSIEVKLAQRTPDISYNASVAAGILLFLVGSMHNKISS